MEGENVAIEYRWAEHQIDRLPQFAAESRSLAVALIAASGAATPALAAKSATSTIPIVFIVGEDPVRLGLVASLNRPGGNLTGINLFSVELSAKRLEFLRAFVPGATRVAVLVNPANASNAEVTVRDVRAAANLLGYRSMSATQVQSRRLRRSLLASTVNGLTLSLSVLIPFSSAVAFS